MKPIWASLDVAWQHESEGLRMVDFWSARPESDETFETFHGQCDTDFIAALCLRGLMLATGFDIKPGECKQVMVTITDVQPTSND